jgi:hypothetical protein
MSDISLPPVYTSNIVSDSTAFGTYERDVLQKVEGYVHSGQGWYRKEESYTQLGRTIASVNGRYDALKPRALSSVFDNRTGKIAFDIASALSEVRPIWTYSTYREQYKRQAEVFSKSARYWWKKVAGDRALLYAVLHALAGGSGFLLQQWNPDLPGGGDIELLPFGVQDVLPIGPVYSESLQDWQGVVLRQRVSAEALINEYPTKEKEIRGSTGSWFGPPPESSSRPKGASAYFQTAFQRLFGPAPAAEPGMSPAGSVDLIWVFLKDYKVHTGDAPVEMGESGKSWTYTVKPGERLYPRGRLIKCVMQGVLDDGPGQYWHGMFPLTRFTLLPLPWSLLGASPLADIAALQESYNDILRGLQDNVNQKLRPAVVTNSSMAQRKLEALDMRQPGQKVRLNMTAGEQFELREVNDLPAYVMEHLRFLRDEMDDNSGTGTLPKVLQQMKQALSADSMDKILDAMSPKLQLMANSIEVGLSEVATLFLTNVMQFYTMPRRYQMLGRDGVTMEDFDFDPNTLVPAPPPGLVDTLQDRAARAIFHKANFSFAVERGTFLEVSQISHRLQMLQLWSRQAVDLWTLLDSFDLPGTGPEPAPTIFERMEWCKKHGLMPGLTAEVAAAQQSLVLAQAAQALAQTGLQNPMMGAPPGAPPVNGPATPPGGAPMIPPGRTNGVGPQGGRPPSASAPPHLETRNGPDGPRQILSESR